MINELFDWLGREGWIIANWWLLATLAGITVMPLLYRLLAALPDRGYSLARPAGILLVAYTFWLLAVLGFVPNTAGNMVLAWLIVLVISLIVYVRVGGAAEWWLWWRRNKSAVIVGELLFALLLLAWAVYRAHQHDLTTTEKPMDLAFMSSSQRSLNFPPADPWLAGYSISYYYFGYVMSAMFSTLSGISTTVGYNMHMAMLFALVGLGVFGLVYNLVRSRQSSPGQDEADYALTRNRSRSALMTGLLASVFVLMMGSYQFALVELPYFGGTASQEYLEFWDVNQRREPITVERPEAPGSDPSSWGYWWWFRSARPISDKALPREVTGDDGLVQTREDHIEVIAEFPNFSFVLGDSHPHVMALPYVLLALGIGLNVLLTNQPPDRWRIVFYGVALGGLIFLNTWDAPIYLGIMIGAELLRRFRARGTLELDDLLSVARMAASVLLVMLLAYSPFLIGFRSQLGGVLPNLVNPTQFQQIFLLFGPLLLMLLLVMVVETWRGAQTRALNWGLAGAVLGAFVGLLAFALIVFTLMGMISDEIRRSALGYVDANGGLNAVIGDALARRFNPKALLTLLVGLGFVALVVARLFPRNPDEAEDTEAEAVAVYPRATGFMLLLIAAAFMLILIPEFVYLRDNFGTRMNTIFKFYYQAWILFSVAAAYGVYSVLADNQVRQPTPLLRAVFALALIAIIGPALLYPAFAIRERAWIETGLANNVARGLTLDGGPTFVSLDQSGDDYRAIMCLAELVGRDPDVVVAEAERDTYRPYYGRVGALTGIPVVANWLGHQTQWRGRGYGETVGSRRPDLNLLYNDLRFDVALGVIEKYGIDYIIYGSTERRDFGDAGEEKFMDTLPVACESGATRIYAVPENLRLLTQAGG